MLFYGFIRDTNISYFEDTLQ